MKNHIYRTSMVFLLMALIPFSKVFSQVSQGIPFRIFPPEQPIYSSASVDGLLRYYNTSIMTNMGDTIVNIIKDNPGVVYDNLENPASLGDYVYIDKYNYSGKENGSSEFPFTTLSNAFEYVYRRYNNGFFRIVRHLKNENVTYGGRITNTGNNTYPNDYVYVYPEKAIEIGLTGQSMRLTGWNSENVGNTLNDHTNCPIRILIRTGNENKNNRFLRSFCCTYDIGGYIVDPNTDLKSKENCIIAIGFENNDGVGLFEDDCGISFRVGDIQLQNVNIMNDDFRLTGRNYTYYFNKSSNFEDFLGIVTEPNNRSTYNINTQRGDIYFRPQNP